MMIEAIRADLTDCFADTKELTGRIHSKFKSEINVILGRPDEPGLTDTRLITIMTPDIPGVPDSVIIRNQDFERLSRLSLDDPVVKTECNIIFAGSLKCRINKSRMVSSRLYFDVHHISAGRQRELSARLEYYFSQGNIRDGFGMTYKQQYDKLSVFAMGLMDYNLPVSIAAFESNLGRGKGLTPSSDDAMVGIMAYTMGSFLAEFSEGQSYYTGFAKEMIHRVRLNNYTTDVSSKYLYCAAEGRFSENLQALIRWIFNNNKACIQRILDKIIQTGSTSGVDMLAGIRIANEVYLRKNVRTSEKRRTKCECIHMR